MTKNQPVISVNVMDMTKDDILSHFMIVPVISINAQTLIDAEPGRGDGKAVVLNCPEERARAIVAVIRMKYGKNEFRCYEGKKRI